ncbi:MAG: hypothetical protein ACXW27_08690 [Allosphingosinicella sp.]
MRIWRVIYDCDTMEFCATRREAEFLERHGEGYAAPLDVPLKKADLIHFLNTEFGIDSPRA